MTTEIPFTYHYVCRACGCRVDCHPVDPAKDDIVMVLVDPKKSIYEFACRPCSARNQ